MKAKVYGANEKIICILENASISHIESNAYRVTGFYAGIITVEQLSNVIVKIYDEEDKEIKRLIDGYAIEITHDAIKNISLIVIQALE